MIEVILQKIGSEIKIYDAKDFPAYLPKLNALYDDLFSGGKGFRAKLIKLFCTHLGLEAKVEHLLAQTIEFIHNASLLHDDLIDRAHLRRGKTTAWLRYTPEYAVLAGDYLLARVMVNLSSHGQIELVHYTANMISDLLEGEWLQDSVVGDAHVSLNQLDRIHNLKTASLFKWCMRSPFIAQKRNDSELHLHLEEMGTLLGQLFQRSDDLLDFDVRNHEGKALLGDLKSKYVNSFASFAMRGLAPHDRTKAISAMSLMDFQKHLGGEEEFKTQIQEFDKLNQVLIERYTYHLSEFAKHLKPEEKKIEQDLKQLPDLLYWRKK